MFAFLPLNGVARRRRPREEISDMFVSLFLISAIVLFVLWILGWFVFHVAGGLIHVLLVVAVITLIVHFVRGKP
jgi:hypothetical protein